MTEFEKMINIVSGDLTNKIRYLSQFLNINPNHPINMSIECVNVEYLASIIYKDADKYIMVLGKQFFQLDADQQYFILAHEMGHVQQLINNPLAVINIYLNVIVKYNVFIAAFLTGVAIVASKYKKTRLQKCCEHLSGGLVSLNIINTILSQHFEYDADIKAITNIKSIKGATSFFKSWSHDGGFFSTHPSNANRLANITKIFSNLKI